MIMRRHSVSINNLVLLVCILAMAFEIGIYYFLNSPALAVIATIILTAAITHFFLELSLDYNVCFLYSLVMVFFSLVITLVIYNSQPNPWIHFHYGLLWMVFLHWFISIFYCIVRDALDRGPRFENFVSYFHRMSILCGIIYLGTIVYIMFIHPLQPPYGAQAFGAHNFVPFMATGNYIEQTLNNGGEIRDMLVYISLVVASGIPFGFFVRLYLREMLFFPRLLFMLLVPFFMEFLQQCINRGRADIDDYFMSLAGVLIGVIIFHIIDKIYHSLGKTKFLMERNKPFSQFY